MPLLLTEKTLRQPLGAQYAPPAQMLTFSIPTNKKPALSGLEKAQVLRSLLMPRTIHQI
jgi:hypothetical protein